MAGGRKLRTLGQNTENVIFGHEKREKNPTNRFLIIDIGTYAGN